MVAAAHPRLRCQTVPLGVPSSSKRARAASRSSRPPGSPDSTLAVPIAPSASASSSGRPERPGHGQDLAAHGQPLGVPAGHEQVHHRAPEDGRLGRRRRGPGDQGHGPVGVDLPVVAPPLQEGQLAQQHLGLGGGHRRARRQQGLAGRGQLLGAGHLAPAAGPAEAEQQLAAGRVALRAQLQRPGQEPGRRLPAAEGGGPVAGVAQGGQGAGGQPRRLGPGGPGERQGGPVVVGEQLGPALGPVGGQPLDPGRRPAGACRPARPAAPGRRRRRGPGCGGRRTRPRRPPARRGRAGGTRGPPGGPGTPPAPAGRGR